MEWKITKPAEIGEAKTRLDAYQPKDARLIKVRVFVTDSLNENNYDAILDKTGPKWRFHDTKEQWRHRIEAVVGNHLQVIALSFQNSLCIEMTTGSGGTAWNLVAIALLVPNIWILITAFRVRILLSVWKKQTPYEHFGSRACIHFFVSLPSR
jgi:hypothetical protein